MYDIETLEDRAQEILDISPLTKYRNIGFNNGTAYAKIGHVYRYTYYWVFAICT